MILILAISLPILFGALMPALKMKKADRDIYLMTATVVTSCLVIFALFTHSGEVKLISFNEQLGLSLRLDHLGRLFAAVIAILWPFTMLYAIAYMKHEEKQTSFFAFFLISYGTTLGIALSDNLLTLYVFYEAMTMATLPLVMHGGSQKAVSAGLKYLYYSLGGSAFAFIGLVYLVYFGGSTAFVPGGLFTGVDLTHTTQLRLGYVLCFLGFGVKAAVFPLHGWLPTASVAPTPVTALLHAVAVVKSGVFAIIRVTYFSFGITVIKGSYAQTVPLILCVFTIVFGCAMALKEKHLKRRLAYSTVSNLSYILFGALLLSQQGLYAGLMHLVFHALMKITLFLTAGVYNERANVYYVDEMRGIAKVYPVFSVIFVIASLAMTGIPPLLGFLSKWFLAQAGFAAANWLAYAGIIALLISAILTGIYLMVPSFAQFFQAKREDQAQQIDWQFKVSLVGLCLILLALTVYNTPVLEFLAKTAASAVTGG